MNLNKVQLIGRLGKDPDVKQISDDNKVCNFTLATTRSYKDKSGEWQNVTQWHNVVIWNNNTCEKLSKGSLVYVEGEIETRKYTDKNGDDKYITEIKAYILKPLEKLEQPNTTADSPADYKAPEDDMEMPF